MSRPLFSLKRDGFLEIEAQGEIVIFDGEKVLFQIEEVMGVFPTRSLLKPFQFLATENSILEDEKRLTACLGSLSASKDQVEQLEIWYKNKKDIISHLKVPTSFPMDEKHRVELKTKGIKPEQIFHTCFSKHMGILEACGSHNWPLEDYLSLKHPYHIRLNQFLSEALNLSHIDYVTDGCQLPSPVLALSNQAKLFQLLASGLGTYEPLRNSMLKYPEWIGGKGRIDTKLMQENQGRVIAKEGADGLLGIGILPSRKFPNGLGIVVKLMMGYQPQFAALAIDPILKFLELKNVTEPPKGQTISFSYEPFKKTNTKYIDISPSISEKTAVWPEDVPFKREVSLSTTTGSHLTLSSITTTVHIGAHCDGLNHFENTTNGIDSAELYKYQGVCQIIEIKKSKGSLIYPNDIQTPIKAPRILFKTTSFPNPEKFNEDFVSLTAELIEFLANKNVVLIGIDTPSIDTFHSKDLPAHHATYKYGLAILEGITLENVAEGIYDLTALPLKILNADASPVRAVLEQRNH